jgi:hypothetical protein
MIRTGISALLAILLSTSSVQIDAQTACRAKVETFAGEKPILTLPAHYRDGIISAVLPNLKADANASGYDLNDLQPAKLARSLHYWPVPANGTDEHMWVVRFTTRQACGPHDSCSSYLIGSDAKGVRNILQDRSGSPGTSAGGAEGIAILPTGNPTHPELLFLSHISGFETAVSCFDWNGSAYRSVGCSPECAHFLDSHRPN